MVPSLRRLLLGSQTRGRTASTRDLLIDALLVPAFTFAATFSAYALGVFEISGCVVFIPGHAAALGFVAAAALVSRGRGLLFAWLVTYASLLGFAADNTFLGRSHLSLFERAADFLDPGMWTFFGVEALVVGTTAFGGGVLVRWAARLVRRYGSGADAR